MPAKIIPIFYLNMDRSARLSHDGLQWILEKAQGRRVPGYDSGFRGQSYVASDKAILLRCIRDKGLTADLNGRRLLAALHANYRAFRIDVETSGMNHVARALGKRARTFPPLPKRSVVALSVRMQGINASRPEFIRRRRFKLAA